MLAFTWLNPHVYLDTMILIGSVSTKFKDENLYEIATPFSNVASLLKSEFNATVLVQNVSALWSKKEQIIDFKG